MEILEADYRDQIQIVRELFTEYVESLDVDISFQNPEEELASLPGEYAPPDGRILIAFEGDKVAGCIAVRRIDDESCEGKRLYVRPECRGRGIGRALSEALINEAKRIGYKIMLLDTVEDLAAANSLYRYLGFVETGPYRYNPLDGAVFMKLDLTPFTER